MLKPAFAVRLFVFVVGVAQAAQAAPPTGFPGFTLVTGGLKIESGRNGLTATRGRQVVWRTPGVIAFGLSAGPGRLFTAEGFQTGVQMAEPKPGSLLIDPATGTVAASVSGTLVNDGPDAAFYLDLTASGNLSGSAPLMTVTLVPLNTLRPEVRQIGSQGLIPAACLSERDSAGSTDFSVWASRGPEVAKSLTINLGNLRCDLVLKLTFATLKVELLSFKPIK